MRASAPAAAAVDVLQRRLQRQQVAVQVADEPHLAQRPPLAHLDGAVVRPGRVLLERQPQRPAPRQPLLHPRDDALRALAADGGLATASRTARQSIPRTSSTFAVRRLRRCRREPRSTAPSARVAHPARIALGAAASTCTPPSVPGGSDGSGSGGSPSRAAFPASGGGGSSGAPAASVDGGASAARGSNAGGSPGLPGLRSMLIHRNPHHPAGADHADRRTFDGRACIGWRRVTRRAGVFGGTRLSMIAAAPDGRRAVRQVRGGGIGGRAPVQDGRRLFGGAVDGRRRGGCGLLAAVRHGSFSTRRRSLSRPDGDQRARRQRRRRITQRRAVQKCGIGGARRRGDAPSAPHQVARQQELRIRRVHVVRRPRTSPAAPCRWRYPPPPAAAPAVCSATSTSLPAARTKPHASHTFTASFCCTKPHCGHFHAMRALRPRAR